jgi:hypothetical protein
MLAALLAMLAAFSAEAAKDDPYLQAINAEGNRLEFLGKAKVEQEKLLRLEAAEKKQADARPVAAAAAPVSQSGFEEALRRRFPGNYALYDLMNPEEKHQVYAEYQKKNAEGSARFVPAVMKIITITNASSANRARALNK